MPYVTDLFLLENLFSNSQVTKRIQYDALSTRILWFSDPYPSQKFDRLPLENQLPNGQVMKRMQCKLVHP